MSAVIVAARTLTEARAWADQHLDAPGEVELVCTSRGVLGRRFDGAWVLPSTSRGLVDAIARGAHRTGAQVWHVDPLVAS